MPGSKDFQDLQTDARGVLFLAGRLLSDVALHPATTLTSKQRENRHTFNEFGEHIYSTLGIKGIANLDDDKVASLLEKTSSKIFELRGNDGDRATASQKRALDAARTACLLRISWLQSDISHFKMDRQLRTEYIVTKSGEEIEFEPETHSYLMVVTPNLQFNQQGKNGQVEITSAGKKPQSQKGRGRSRKPGGSKPS